MLLRTRHPRRIGFTALAAAATLLSASARGAEASGSDIYASQCLPCHGADGAGTMPGVPDLTLRAGVLAKSDELLLDSLIGGVQRPGAAVAMPPLGGNPLLTPADMRAVLTFLRREFAPPAASPKGEK